MKRIELGDFLIIAELHTGIDAHQLARIPRVVQLAEAALAPIRRLRTSRPTPNRMRRPPSTARGSSPTIPLPDGNKRTAYDVMREFIDRNGGTFTHPVGGLDATADVIEQLAASLISEPEFIDWVRNRVAGHV